MEQSKRIEAFMKQLADDKITSDKKRIVEQIKNGAKTIDLLVLALRLPYSTVSARVSDLRSMGLIRLIYSPFNKQSVLTYISDEKAQQNARNEVEEEKKQAWLKRGKRKGWI